MLRLEGNSRSVALAPENGAAAEPLEGGTHAG
jgi:hypothetical protein